MYKGLICLPLSAASTSHVESMLRSIVSHWHCAGSPSTQLSTLRNFGLLNLSNSYFFWFPLISFFFIEAASGFHIKGWSALFFFTAHRDMISSTSNQSHYWPRGTSKRGGLTDGRTDRPTHWWRCENDHEFLNHVHELYLWVLETQLFQYILSGWGIAASAPLNMIYSISHLHKIVRAYTRAFGCPFIAIELATEMFKGFNRRHHFWIVSNTNYWLDNFYASTIGQVPVIALAQVPFFQPLLGSPLPGSPSQKQLHCYPSLNKLLDLESMKTVFFFVNQIWVYMDQSS